LLDKGAVISLPYGVEGFSTPKHLVKEDGSQAQPDEKLSFKVIEFNKDSKRIILSHSRVFEDEQRAEAKKEKEAAAVTTIQTEKKPRKSKKDKKEVEEIQQMSIEKTTLGDISELAELKEKMKKDSN